MIAYKDYITFTILGKEIFLYSEGLEWGQNTVAEMDKRIYYLGHEQAGVGAAIIAWQVFNNRELTDDEFSQVLTENHLNSSAV